jgi:hypothetical protein
MTARLDKNQLIHPFNTDDPDGIEKYWDREFVALETFPEGSDKR